MKLNVKSKCTVTLTQTRAYVNINFKSEKQKRFLLWIIEICTCQICTICATSSQNFLGKDPKSLLPLPKHIQTSYTYTLYTT